MADSIIDPLQIRIQKSAQRAAGANIKLKMFFDPANESSAILPDYRKFMCESGHPKCTASDQALSSEIRSIQAPKALSISGKSCSIIFPATAVTRLRTEQSQQSGQSDSYLVFSPRTASEALENMAAHEGGHCRQRYSTRALRNIPIDGGAAVMNERALHEQAAEMGASLFTLKDVYRSGSATRITEVTTKMSRTADIYESSRDEIYAPLARVIRYALSQPVDRIANLPDARIHEIVDAVSTGKGFSL